METGITGPEGQQACTAQHTKIREHRTRVWGEECKQVEQRNQSPGCGDRSGRAVIPTSLPSEPGPNTHTHTHTHTHTQLTDGCDSTFLCWLQQKHGTIW